MLTRNLVGPEFCSAPYPKNPVNMAQSNPSLCSHQIQCIYKKSSSWSCNRGLEWALPLYQWDPCKVQPPILSTSSTPGPSFRKERPGRCGFSISSPQLPHILPIGKEPQLFRKRHETHCMEQSILHWGSMSLLRHLLITTSTMISAIDCNPEIIS